MRIKKWLRNWLDSDEKIQCDQTKVSCSDAVYEKPGRSVRFVVTEGDGGIIISFNTYDHKTDRETGGVYIRPGDCDFGKEIEQIFMMEKLKR